jgi:death-on-curing protein
VTVEWIAYQTALIYHDLQIEEHGGAHGVRGEGAVQSALARPENLAAYGEPDLFDLAAAYAHGIVQNHPFVDGNKRTGFVVAVSFLDLNGRALEVDEAEAAVIFLRLAAGELSEPDLAAWFRRNASRPDADYLVREQDQ